ncbi:translation initiation factor IF-2-like [Peromyscus californicus insignis]|uniref:translation initiation factor IF-2-like n=1 Tax=Peromyscus californicus insignis TaxID=564181 RepID=UPI0022A7928E|nr:translation initiation factor IF-2-like [Peromyscus californicus insignis]
MNALHSPALGSSPRTRGGQDEPAKPETHRTPEAARFLPSSSSFSSSTSAARQRRRRGGGDGGGTRAPVPRSPARAWGSVARGGGAAGGWRGGSSWPGTRGAGAQAAGCGQTGSGARGLLGRAPWLRRGRHHLRGSLVALSLQECGRLRGMPSLQLPSWSPPPTSSRTLSFRLRFLLPPPRPSTGALAAWNPGPAREPTSVREQSASWQRSAWFG